MDADGVVTFTGGTIIYGGTGVGSAPGGDSTQSYVFVDSDITAGKEITVKKDGQTLMAFTPPETLRYLALSSPDIMSGESYEIHGGGSLLTTVTAGVGGSGMPAGGPGGMGNPGEMGGPGEMEGPGEMGSPGEMGGPGGRR